MEKREEIKDGVKQRIIEFMAEQITKEESFVDLKSEFIQEFLVKKDIKQSVQEELEPLVVSPEQKQRDAQWRKDFGFTFNKESAENRLKNLAKEKGIVDTPFTKRDNIAETLKKIKEGTFSASLKGFAVDHSNEPGLAEVYIKLNDKFKIGEYDRINFSDYALKYKYTETEKKELRQDIVNFIKNNETRFWVETFNNDPNYYKKYSITNVSIKPDTKDYMTFSSGKNDFRLNISVIYNDITKSYYVDNFDCSMDSRYMMDKDLGLIFAVEVLEMLRKMEMVDNQKFTENVFNSVETAKEDDFVESIRNGIKDSDNNSKSITDEVVQDAMRHTAKDVREPKVVRDGIVKPEKKEININKRQIKGNKKDK